MNASKRENNSRKRCRGPYLSWMSAPDVKEPRVSEWRTRSLDADVCNAATCSNAACTCALDSSDTDSQGEEASNSCEILGSTVANGVEIDHQEFVSCVDGEEKAPNITDVEDFGHPPNDDGIINLESFEEECSPRCYCSNCRYADDEEFSWCNDLEGLFKNVIFDYLRCFLASGQWAFHNPKCHQ